eukprot:11194454-Lingulodinium_polyedra.AAC.1
MKHGFYGQRLASGHLMVDLLSDDCCRALTQARDAALAATRPVEEPASDEEMAQFGAARTNLRMPAEREASSSRRSVQVCEVNEAFYQAEVEGNCEASERDVVRET